MMGKTRRRLAELVSLAVLAAGGGAGPASAGPLNPGRVGSDAAWVVHLNMESMGASPVVRHVLAHPGTFDLEGLEQVKRELGVDVMRDIFGVTLYGPGSPGERATEDNVVAVVEMTAKADDLVAMLKQMGAPGKPGAAEMNYLEIKVKDYTIHSWRDNGEPRFGSVRPGADASRRTVVFGSDLGRVVRALEVIDGKSAAIDPGSGGLLTEQPGAGSVLFISVGGDGLSRIGENEPENPASAVMRRAKSAVFDAGDEEDKAYARLSIDAADDKQAAQVAAVAQGLLALGALASMELAEMRPMSEAIQGVQVVAEGSRVRIRGGWEHEKVIGALEAAARHGSAGLKKGVGAGEKGR